MAPNPHALNSFAWRSGWALGDTSKDLETTIPALLKGWLLDYEFEDVGTVIKQQQHRYRAASALQKAIRRGNVTVALRMANGIYGLDPEYIWRRMAVLVVEEIGVADVELVAAVLWANTKRVWREKNGGDKPYLYMLVERMCRSVKDRSPCDLVCWVDWAPGLAGLREQWLCGFAPSLARLNMLDPDGYLAERMLAGWSMVGTKKARPESMAEGAAALEGSTPDFLQAWQFHTAVKLPPAVLFIMQQALNKTGDAMGIAYPLIWQMINNSASAVPGLIPHRNWQADDLAGATMPMLGNYPSEAFDQFVRQGKNAITMWTRECPPIRHMVENIWGKNPDLQATQPATRILVFRAEGSLVDRRLVFEGSKDLLDLAELALNESQGVPGRWNDHSMELTRLNLPWLHHCRKRVLDMIPPGVEDKPPLPVFFADLDNMVPSEAKVSASPPHKPKPKMTIKLPKKH